MNYANFKIISKIFAKIGLAFMLSISFYNIANCHPHAWIEYKVEPKINAKGYMVGLLQTWKFDPYYSVFLLEEQKNMGAIKNYQARLNKLGNFMLNNMARVDYFTKLENAKIARAELRYLHDKNSRMIMQFYLPFSTPIEPQVSVKYWVFDPTYYIDMQHEKNHNLKFKNCRLKITKANPSQKLINQALALDKSAKPSEKLGILFADKGTLLCQN